VHIRINPKTRHLHVEARYIRTTCTDSSTPGGVNPGPMKTNAGRSGRFHATLSDSDSFLYLQGRITAHQAHGELFLWFTRGPGVTCSTGTIPWSIPRT
jgi:hypothetical protein